MLGWCAPQGLAHLKHPRKVSNAVYRFQQEERGKFAVWIVDGDRVRDSVYSNWLYGGNDERYRFNPPHEIWIDNAIGCQEYKYTLAHELLEQHLIARYGWTYDDAHDSALMLENRMRHADSMECARHEHELPRMPPIDNDSTKELPRLPKLIRLSHVYLQHFETVDSCEVWIVDGNVVRRDIFPDFGFSGNGLAYYFIPRNEIWLDNAMSCADIKFSLLTELLERALMARGVDYDDAYERAVHRARDRMRQLYREAARHAPIIVPNPPDREKGTG